MKFQFQILLFCHFLGTSSLYHVLRDVKGPSSPTVCRVVHRVANCLINLKDDIIRWPADCQGLAGKFFQYGGFPSTAGCLDGCHVRVIPPAKDQTDYINRHHDFSINMLAVAGPDLKFYYINTNYGGRCHDSHVLRQSSLWDQFENRGSRPFPGAVLLGDSAYPLSDWLLTPYSGDPQGNKALYNRAHIVTRNIVERAFGILKKRFLSLGTGISNAQQRKI